MYAASEIAETLYGLQTPPCHRGERDVRRNQQIAECLTVATPHTTAQLMQLTQTEVLRVVHYDRVDIGHIYATLYDGGGYKHVIVMVGEVDDCLLKLIGGHLAVANYHAGIRHETFHLRFKVIQTLDAIVDDEHLAVARELKVDGLLYYVIATGIDRCDDRVTVGWRSVDSREVTCAHQRELQCARYGCRTHGKRVDIDLHLLKFLLDGDAEFLFLIHYQQTQILELDILTYYLMRAYKDIYLTVGQILEHPLHLLGSACAGQVINPHRKLLQAFTECVVMLICQHSGGHEHGALLAVDGSLECSTYGHLSLSETHIAAYKSVHGFFALHVSFHSLSGSELVRSILVDE